MEQELQRMLRTIYEAHQKILLYKTELEKERCNERFEYLRSQDKTLKREDGRSRKQLHIPEAHKILEIPIDRIKINETLKHKFLLDLGEGYPGGGGILGLLYDLSGYICDENGEIVQDVENPYTRNIFGELKGIYHSLFPDNNLEVLIKEHDQKIMREHKVPVNISLFKK